MIEVRATEEADLASLSALFAERFGHPLTAEEWAWKYRQVPGEGRSLVAVDAAGAVVAHAGLLRLAARWRGGSGGIWQLVDFVGAPRGGALRPALVGVGRKLLADLPAAGEVPWMFGFPSERHFRLGNRVFGYRWLTRILPLAGELPGPASAAAAAAADGDVGQPLFAAGDSCGDWAAAVWERCGVLGVERRAAFLNWRYWARPGRYYRFYRLRAADPSGAEGLAVFAFVGDEAWAAELWLPPGGEWYAPLLAVAGDLRAAGLRRWRFWPPPVAGGAEPAPRPVELAERGESPEAYPPADPFEPQDDSDPGQPASANPPRSPEPTAAVLWRLGLRPDGDVRWVAYRGATDGADPAAAAAGFYHAMGDFDLA
jgi:hypothetical protein